MIFDQVKFKSSKAAKMSDPLLQKLKDQFPTLQIEFINDSICVNMQGFWYSLAKKGSNNELEINGDALKLTENYVIFKRLETSFLGKDPTKYGGLYIVVDSEDSRFLHDTEGDALSAAKGPHSFVGRIGQG